MVPPGLMDGIGSMAMETTDTVVVGAGQAGIAASEHLSAARVPHIVLERGRIAESWRSARWHSLVMNDQAWHGRFPNRLFATDPEGFPGKQKVACYFEGYAAPIDASLRCGVTVDRVRKIEGARRFRVETSRGVIEATNVIAATGPFQRPVMPDLAPDCAVAVQIHFHACRNPAQFPEGAVLVVGDGSSGSQIADELRRAGRRVFFSVGLHGRQPCRYRERDFCWWLGVMGKWDAPAPAPGTAHVTIAFSGAEGRRTMDFRQLVSEGVTLLGRTGAYGDGVLHFASDLARNIARGDADYHAFLDDADAYATRMGEGLPPEPEARRLPPDPEALRHPILTLDLAASGIVAIVWATGYARDYAWLEVDAFDAGGSPNHKRGVTSEPGIYFLGLPWQSRRGSSFIWGGWHEARHVADQIVTQRSYLAYAPVAEPRLKKRTRP